MHYVDRLIETAIKRALNRNKSVLLLGPRQTGKTTTILRLAADLYLSLSRPETRLRYEKNPELLTAEVESLAETWTNRKRRPVIALDEVQKVPALLDGIQDLIDNGLADFVLCGSSARKLKRGGAVNLLPGRVLVLRLDSFVIRERADIPLEQHLLYGSLPGISMLESDRDREADLASYVTTYLEQEIRAEALVRKLGAFARFLELAAVEAGYPINLRKLSQQVGVSHTTIGSYYEILEDCLIGERIEPLTHSATRKKLIKSERWLFFDLGVRRIAAAEGIRLPPARMGHLFEHFIGLELLRCSRLTAEPTRLRFWRDADGPEVDWILEQGQKLVPIEVKWTDAPTRSHVRHLHLFMNEYPAADRAYVVCRSPRRLKLGDRIEAIPWQEVDALVSG
jgi:predicted AAA+ superfamily ATPase